MDPGFDALLDQVKAASREWQQEVEYRKSTASQALERAEVALREAALIVRDFSDQLEAATQAAKNLRSAISTHRDWVQAGVDPDAVNEMLWHSLDEEQS